VHVGPSADDQVSISEGLKVGDRVVTEGGDRLVDGSEVHLPGQGPAAQGAAGKKQWNGKQRGFGNGGKRHRPSDSSSE
jgi:multidrug efflux system membrane fusion protein